MTALLPAPLIHSSAAGSIERTSVQTKLILMYVYLTGGAVLEVEGGSVTSFSDDEMIVSGAEGELVRFPRASVFFAARTRVSPPVLF